MNLVFTKNLIKTLIAIPRILVLSIPFFLLSSKAYTQPTEPERYSDRPDILNVPARESVGLSSAWKKLLGAQVDFAAQILGLYSEGERIVFLARDAEYVYDLARVLDPTNQKIALANISRANMSDPALRDYLSTFGITPSVLMAGQRIIFVDTGFAGTIPKQIQSAYAGAFDSQLRTHLIVSDNIAHPSSRVFLIHLNAAIALRDPASLHSSIVNYEHMPHYTFRADGFLRETPNVIIPTSEEFDEDGKVSRSEARLMMSDLRAYAENPGVQTRFVLFRNFWSRLRSELSKPEVLDSTLRQLIADPQSVAGIAFSPTEVEAIIRDLYEANSRNLKGGQLKPISSLGLPDIVAEEPQLKSTSKSQKEILIEQYPQYKAIFLDPSTELKKLFVKQDWITIAALMELSLDHEMIDMLIERLNVSADSGKAQELLESKITDQAWQHALLVSTNLANKILDWMEKKVEKKDLFVGNAFLNDMDFFEFELSDGLRLTFSILKHRPNEASRLLARLADIDLFKLSFIDDGYSGTHSQLRELASIDHKLLDRLIRIIVNTDKEILKKETDSITSDPISGDDVFQIIERCFGRKWLSQLFVQRPHILGTWDLDKFDIKRLLGSSFTSDLKMIGEKLSLSGVEIPKDHPSYQMLLNLLRIEESIKALRNQAKMPVHEYNTLSLERDKNVESIRSWLSSLKSPEPQANQIGKSTEKASENNNKVYRPQSLDEIDKRKRELERFRVLEEMGLNPGVHAQWIEGGKALARTFVVGKTLREIIESEPSFLDDVSHPAAVALKKFIEKFASKRIYVGALGADAIVYDGHEWKIIKPGRVRERENSTIPILLAEWAEKMFSSLEKDFPTKAPGIKGMLERITCVSILRDLSFLQKPGPREGFISP